jgi:hypothetical protein
MIHCSPTSNLPKKRDEVKVLRSMGDRRKIWRRDGVDDFNRAATGMAAEVR